MGGTDTIAGKIREAFAQAEYPGNDKIVAPTYDDEGTSELFVESDRYRLAPKDLANHVDSLCFFTPEAFRYFLPAFMLVELEHPDQSGMIAETVLFHFTPTTDQGAIARYQRRIQCFTPKEREAIAAFLTYIQRVHEFPNEDATIAITHLQTERP